MIQKLTEVFPPDIKPVYVGVYLASVLPIDDNTYRYWSGEKFMAACGSVEQALSAKDDETINKQCDIHWRGIAK